MILSLTKSPVKGILLPGDIFMAKYAVVDFRMRKIEKEYIKSLGYILVENEFNLNTYDEISAHPDIYYTKIGDVIFAAPEKAKKAPFNVVNCVTEVGDKYPLDVPYNVCVVGNNALHNFKYTDNIVKFYLERHEYNMVNVEQGYTKCSVCVVDDNSCITTDIGIAGALMDLGVDTLFVSEPEIKLKRRTNKIFVNQNQMSFEDSPMQGFIGGAMARLGDTIVIFGDIENLVNGNKIRKFIEKKGLKLHYFEGLDVVDYGGVIEVIENE